MDIKEYNKLVIRNKDLENQNKTLKNNIDILKKKIDKGETLEENLLKMMFSKWINNILFVVLLILLYIKL